MTPAGPAEPANRLDRESSPYLLQHADNPVAWYPWGTEALERARDLDRPILLSIGYSACHWCHVMERESFSNPAIAELQNALFVSVKVDREERPDLDSIYMRAVQAMTGRGGWPLTAFLTPEGLPFYGGTYFPPERRHGMPGFPEILEAVDRAWRDRREEVEASATEIHEMLERSARSGPAGTDRPPGLALGDDAAGPSTDPALPDPARSIRGILADFDSVRGGFGGAPKFPQPMVLEALMTAAAVEDASGLPSEALDAARRTLDAMAAGGIRDQLGGGFHRYATDARWLVPHFEKMLYDNALLARAYLQAWRITGESGFRDEVVATLEWLLSEMRAPEGGFFAALDADSEGEEGRFYVWDAREIREALGAVAPLFEEHYGVSDEGNWEGTNILHRPSFGTPPAGGRGRPDLKDPPAGENRLAEARTRLLEIRNRRERPFRDTKVLASWNGMALRAFAEAGAALDERRYVDVAAQDVAALLEALTDPDGRLRHQLTDGRSAVPAFLDDTAALGLASLAVHEATLEAGPLAAAARLAEQVLARYLDPETDLLMDTPADAEPLIVRPREILDNAVPSGTSLAAELLFRLGRILGREEWEARARRIVARERPSIERAPHGFGRLLALSFAMGAPPEEIVITGDPDDPRTHALLREVHRTPRPGRVLAGGRLEDLRTHLPEPGPLFEGRGPVDGHPAAWVCRRYSCRAPVTTPDELRDALAADP